MSRNSTKEVAAHPAAVLLPAKVLAFGKRAQTRERELLQSEGLARIEVEPPWTVKEAAAFLRTTPKALYARVERGQIPHIRDGRRLLFWGDELVEWLRHKSIAVTGGRAA